MAVGVSFGSSPLIAVRDIPIAGRVERVDADYNGDGINELMAWWTPAKQQLIDGKTGRVFPDMDGTCLRP